MTRLPRFEGTGKNTTFFVDGKPFHARAGEIHNSSASNLTYMDERVWPALRDMHLNTLIAPVYWECIEPSEGCFDFTLLDGLVEQAQRENMRLILLWFGLWKNSASTYVPDWVKTDSTRFFCIKAPGGLPLLYRHIRPHRVISPFCTEAVEADARAFCAVMAHLRETDQQHTVIAIQVENEIGVLGAARDYGDRAEAAFSQPVPDRLCQALGVSGTWTQAFGADAAESFMAWYYACAVERIAGAGKAVYPLPMYVNAWLELAPWTAGSYPSGGPQFKMHRIWRAAAPSIDAFAPDIYADNFRDIADEYADNGNPLFIPEVRHNADAVSFYLYAVGRHNVLCFAPFGIEDADGVSALDAQTLALLNIHPEAMNSTGANRLLGIAYEAVENMEPLIEQAHRDGNIHGFLSNGETDETIPLSNLDLRLTYPTDKSGGGLVIELDDYEFIVLAVNCTLQVDAAEGAGVYLDILSKEEGTFRDGQWIRGRILNGDEQMRHIFGPVPSFLRFRLHPYIL